MSRLAFLLFLGLAGCLSPGTSDPAEDWQLPAPTQLGARVRVFLPAELRTPRVVAADTSGGMVERDLDRWDIPLAAALGRLISGHLATGTALRGAVVEFRVLRVDTRGRCRVHADYRMTTWSFPGGPDVEVEGSAVADIPGNAEGTERERILAGYAAAAERVAAAMRGDLARTSNGEVAKPAPGVTLPGR